MKPASLLGIKHEVLARIPVVILCGGQGIRFREATEKLPKPLVNIGDRPMLWHIMKIYLHFGFRRFVLCLGYKSDDIKRYFLEYRHRQGDFTLVPDSTVPLFHDTGLTEGWEITFAETGMHTGTGARLSRIAHYLDSEHFMLTYGDGVGDVNLSTLVQTHLAAGRIGTVTAVHPGSRYGEMAVRGDAVTDFNEKPPMKANWVSGGFFMFRRAFVDKYLDDDPALRLEERPLRQLALDGELTLFPHDGFWMGMDTYRDWIDLNEHWERRSAAWKVWPD
jgi:glucose-1-phosphate cytidylyltransferase